MPKLPRHALALSVELVFGPCRTIDTLSQMSATPAAPFAALMPAGPGTAELDRIADTLESMHFFEPNVSRVVIVDDEPGANRDVLGAAGPLRDRTTVIANPRSRTAHWWSEGVLVGVAAGLEELLGNGPPVDWVLRLDTDALIIGPFSGSISDRFASDSRIGLVGSYLRRADGTLRDFSGPAKPLRKLRAPVSVWRRQRRVKTSLFGVARERRHVIEAAERNGYQLGQHCQGGAYALSMEAVRSIGSRGWLDCRLWRGTYVSEDVIMAVQIRSLGYLMEGMVEPGEPFAVRHVGLPGEPRALRDAGHGVVHSIKTHGNWTEQGLRDEFRALRLEQAAPDP